MAVGLLLVGLSCLAMTSAVSAAPEDDGDVTAQLNDPDIIAKGEYLARIGDCAACHTGRDGVAYAGGRSLPTPFGSVPAPNITPDRETGIGTWDFDDFWSAFHDGRAADGTLLYPVFPYTSYTRVTRDDAMAIFAYLRSLPPIHRRDKQPQLRFPFDIRKGLYVWRMLYFSRGVYQPDPDQSDQWNRGAYLVEGLGHCNECHTSRTVLGGVAQDNYLSGGVIPAQNWYAPSLNKGPGGALEGWDVDDLVRLLKTGQSPQGAVFGPMAEVVRRSTQHISESDLRAMATYLLSQPAHSATRDEDVARAGNYHQGRRLYKQYCSDCHGDDGAGVKNIYPALDGDAAITGKTGVNAIRSVLLGGFPPATKGNPRPYSMPPFAQKLSDGEVAAVVNYVRQAWSNNAAAVTAEDVKTLRKLPLY